MSDNSSNRSIFAIFTAILLLLAGVLGWFLWKQTKEMRAETEKKQQEYLALQQEKDQLIFSLDSLSTSYSNLRIEYENLEGKVVSSAKLVEQKEKVITEIRNTSAAELEALRRQVEDLRTNKAELGGLVEALQAENTALKNENTALKGENQQLQGKNEALTGQVSDLAKDLEAQIRKTQSANFKATAFRVEVERKGDKLTGKAKRAREINVSFDLADVPQQYQGPNKLYLVISDEKGNPIPTTNPIKQTVAAPTGPVDILAQQSRAVNLEKTQRIPFTYTFDDRLKGGNYIVAIYCDKGLLGVSSFRLM